MIILGRHYNIDPLKVLCSRNQDRLYWDPVNWDKYDGEDLDDAVIAGFQKDIRSDLYIGRLKLPHIYKVGKVVPPDRDAPGLWVWREDEPLRVTKFELLKYNDTEIY